MMNLFHKTDLSLKPRNYVVSSKSLLRLGPFFGQKLMFLCFVVCFDLGLFFAIIASSG